MPHQPHTPRTPGPLEVTQTETGTRVNLQAGALRLNLAGLADEDEAQWIALLVLDALAKRRGVQPARVADRTLPNLVAALEASP